MYNKERNHMAMIRYLLVWFCLSVATAHAQPVVQYHYYEMSAQNVQELSESFKENPPYIEWEIQWQFTPKRRKFGWKPECQMTFVEVEPRLTIYKHVRGEEHSLEQDMEQLWQEYTERVQAYEQTHIAHVQRAVESVKEQLAQLPASANCLLLRKDVYRLVDEITIRYQQTGRLLSHTTASGHMSLVGVGWDVLASQYSSHNNPPEEMVIMQITPLSLEIDKP